MELVVIGVAALLTAILSAVAGLGGGVILLSVLAQFFAPVTAIPIQGGIQLFSNGSRAIIMRAGINWSAVWRSSLLLLPASFLGVLVATSIPEDTTRLILGLFILLITWRPSVLRWRGQNALPKNTLVGVGAVSGFLNTTVGASGPFTSPFFKAFTASHAAFVATAAAAQVIAHTSKLVAFSFDDFAIGDHLDVIGVGAVGVIMGSFVGARLLGRIDEDKLALLFRTVLTLLAIRLIVRALL